MDITLEKYLMYVILPILCLSLIIIFIRFLKGPDTVDRVITLDLMVTIGVGIIAIFSTMSNNSNFLDDAMILALIAFLGTIAFAYYLEKSKIND